MKKLFLLITAFALLLTACKKEYVPVSNTQSILINVPTESWGTGDGGVTYSVRLNVPELSSDINYNGQVSVYISYGNGVFEQIPEVYGDTSYSFTHSPGYVTLYTQNINNIRTYSPDNMQVKVVLTDGGN